MTHTEVDVADSLGRIRTVQGGTYSSSTVVQGTPGLTYRQLDHWRAAGALPGGGQGSGRWQRWTWDEIVLLRCLVAVNQALRPVSTQGASTDFLCRVWMSLQESGEFTYDAPPVHIHVSRTQV